MFLWPAAMPQMSQSDLATLTRTWQHSLGCRSRIWQHSLTHPLPLYEKPKLLKALVAVTLHLSAQFNRFSPRSTLRCIAERLLPTSHEQTYLQKEIVNEKIGWPPATERYHIYCSRKNPGAPELLQEFADNQGLTLKRTAVLRRRLIRRGVFPAPGWTDGSAQTCATKHCM